MNLMQHLTARWAAAAIGICSIFQVVAGTRELSSPELMVRVDTAFPRVVDYQWKASGASFYGQEEALHEVTINGTNYTPKVRCSARGKDVVNYVLGFTTIKVEITVAMRLSGNVLEFAVTNIKESGPVKVMTIAIPNHSLLSVRSTQPGAAFIGAQVGKADVEGRVAERKVDVKPLPFTHAVLYTRELAASVYNNVLLDNDRLFVQTRDSGAEKVCALWCPLWTYRAVTNETLPLPFAQVVITGDRNGDGMVDWQDGAIAYRPLEPAPFGAELVKKRLTSQIAMNFASYAQHPFLRVLDSVKMMYLQTDGLGQEIQFKGYQTEGHDSSHPDYGGNVGRRQGGRDEFNYVMRRMKDYNATAGIHINATEYYPEAKHYSLDLVNTNKPGWAWLDQSYYTDQHYDIVSGKLYQRLNEMRTDLPTLDWVYVDVYFGVGWEAYKLATKMTSLGLPIYTEFPWLMERFITWNHTAQDWTQKIWGDGRKSKLARFIQNTSRDVWSHEPLLRGSQNDGFLGWHGQRDVNAVVRSTFVVNLPSKYLQHFPIKRCTAKRIDFEGGVSAADEGGTMKIYRSGKLCNTCRYPGSNCPPVDCVLFMPWDPITETKIYHWNDQGGTTTWQLPESWLSVNEALLYELTPVGRVRVCALPVKNGQVTVDASPRTPYVLYKTAPPPLPEVVWGEGSLVKDPG
ncbi:MAG: endo-alpha-N-acetylgalactosaminidase family protein, partial [Verrucomicrobia bacterium]|nr:endo-alpha-N-acetylgalactosaminidase family protein [Verrucomicrobiota bacterium]